MNTQNQFTPLYVKKPNGRYTLAKPDDVVTCANEIVEAIYTRSSSLKITDPRTAREHLYLRLHKEHEVFVAMFLDSKHRVIKVEELFRGTIDSSSVPVREVVKDALKHNAAAMIVAHNHPSGVCEPSQADKTLTETLNLALGMIGVKLLDHFVFGEGGYDGGYSFAEHGGLY